jgi:hypothetical protein
MASTLLKGKYLAPQAPLSTFNLGDKLREAAKKLWGSELADSFMENLAALDLNISADPGTGLDVTPCLDIFPREGEIYSVVAGYAQNARFAYAADDMCMIYVPMKDQVSMVTFRYTRAFRDVPIIDDLYMR